MDNNILVLNMGMKSIRSIIFDAFGNKLATASCPLSTGLNNKYVFQDPNEWWNCAVQVIRDSIQQIAGSLVKYITVSASSSCLVYVDEMCNALDACIMVSDRRTEEQDNRIAELTRCGILFGDLKDGSASSSMLAKILWVKENQPDKYKNTAHFLSPNDYLIAKLTGRYVTDTFNALKYCYDINKGCYPQEELRILGIEESKLPAVAEVGTILGILQSDIAALLHLPADVEVVLTTYDAICSFFGSGVLKEGDASDVSGTVTVFRTLTYQNEICNTQNVFLLPYKKGHCQIIGGSNNLGGGLIEWIKQCYYRGDRSPYIAMEQDAEASSVGAGGLIFLPYLLGERAPLWDDTVRGMFFGLERYHTRKDMTRAVFESTGFIDLDFVNEIEKTGVAIQDIRVSGGLARMDLVNQIKADITGKNVLVLSEFETTAAGAAMLAYEALGYFPNMQAAAAKFVNVRMLLKPNHENHVKYQKLYSLYKHIYCETSDLFKERQKICAEIYNDFMYTIDNI